MGTEKIRGVPIRVEKWSTTLSFRWSSRKRPRTRSPAARAARGEDADDTRRLAGAAGPAGDAAARPRAAGRAHRADDTGQV